MAKIEIDRELRGTLARQIQAYFEQELDQEIGLFDAEFLLDFFAEEIGPHFYNQGLYDAQALAQSQVESFNDAIYTLEKSPRSES